jgi:hypothetical protein
MILKGKARQGDKGQEQQTEKANRATTRGIRIDQPLYQRRGLLPLS